MLGQCWYRLGLGVWDYATLLAPITLTFAGLLIIDYFLLHQLNIPQP